jgi:hypothetical protein
MREHSDLAIKAGERLMYLATVKGPPKLYGGIHFDTLRVVLETL